MCSVSSKVMRLQLQNKHASTENEANIDLPAVNTRTTRGRTTKELTCFGSFEAVEFLRTNLNFCSGILSPSCLSWLERYPETGSCLFWLSSLNILMILHVKQRTVLDTKNDIC